LVFVLDHYLLVSRPRPTRFVYRGGAQSNREITQRSVTAEALLKGIWDDLRSRSYVDTDPAAEGAPILGGFLSVFLCINFITTHLPSTAP